MDISLEDLKDALYYAQVHGFSTPGDLAGFAWGYLSAKPLTANAEAAATPQPNLPEVIRDVDQLDLGWPYGTRIIDKAQDTWEYRGGDGWTVVRWEGSDTDRDPEDIENSPRWNLAGYLPAIVVHLGW